MTYEENIGKHQLVAIEITGTLLTSKTFILDSKFS